MKRRKKENLIPDILNEMDNISKSFWSTPSGSFSSLTAYYSENLEKCISGANFITDNYTKETALFWSELIRTDFIIKFGIESQFNLNFKKKVVDIKEAVAIIKNTFENSYEYFAFYTISNKLDLDKLYNLWYKPFKAKELATEKEESFWTIDGKKVSGKYWVLNNCELLKFSELDIKWMKYIRDAESHENLVYTLEGIAILEGAKTRELKKEEVIRFAEFLKECIGLIFHFALTFLIKEKFWIFISSFIATENKYRNSGAPFHLLGKVSEKSKEKLDLENLIKPGFCAIVGILVKYSLHELWDDIEVESNRLNNRLKNVGFKFKADEIEDLRLGAQCDLYNTVSLFNYKTRQLSLGIEEDIFEEKTIENIKSADFDTLFADMQKSAKTVLRLKKSKENMWLLVSIFLGVGLTVMLPMSRLYNNFDSLIIPINDK